MFKNTLIFEATDATLITDNGKVAPLTLDDEDRVWLTQKGVFITDQYDQAVTRVMTGQFLIVAIAAEKVTPEVSKFMRICQRHLGILPQWQVIVGNNPDFDLQAQAMESGIKTFWPLAELRKTLAPWILEQNKILTDKTEDADRSLRVGVAIAQGKYDVIEKSIESLKADAQFDYRVAFHLGIYYDTQLQADLSLQFFTKSLELNSKFIPAIYRQAQKLLETGHAADSLKGFERLEMINPKNPDRKALMAQAYADIGDWDQAKALRDAATELEPDNPLARELNVRIAFESGNTESALDALEQCQSTNDYFIKKLNAEAVKLSQNGKTEEALRLYEKAWEIAPAGVKFRISYNVALAHYRQNVFDRALEYCDRAAQECTDPSFDKISKLHKILNEKVA
jgi:tetratricopeptide (TPR) repeat protein